MTLGEILAKLNAISPFALAEPWDNSGLQIGDLQSSVSEIVLTLECSLDTALAAPCGSLIIAHHPLIFKPLKNLDFGRLPILKELIKKDVCVVATHTNFDVTHLNRAFAAKLGLVGGACEGFVYKADFNGSFNELAQNVKTRLNLEHVNVVEPKNDFIKTVAVVCGSGADLIDKIDADAFITGDVKYHQAMSAYDCGIGVIDATHYASEIIFCDVLQELLKDVGVKVGSYISPNPFKVF